MPALQREGAKRRARRDPRAAPKPPELAHPVRRDVRGEGRRAARGPGTDRPRRGEGRAQGRRAPGARHRRHRAVRQEIGASRRSRSDPRGARGAPGRASRARIPVGRRAAARRRARPGRDAQAPRGAPSKGRRRGILQPRLGRGRRENRARRGGNIGKVRGHDRRASRPAGASIAPEPPAVVPTVPRGARGRDDRGAGL